MFFNVQRLCFSYYRSPMTLKDVSFSLEKSSKVLILASKDMGKTTALKVLSGFEDSRFGNIYLNGKELKEVSDQEKGFSLVLAEPVLIEKKSIADNINYQCEICEKEKLSNEQVLTLLKGFDFDKDVNTKVKKLSLFEKRILQIVRAKIKNPNILFLDDQFEDLVCEDKLKMISVYDKLMGDKNLTIIYTIGDESFRFLKGQKFEFNYDKVLYLNLAAVQEFRAIEDFEKAYSLLDILKFYVGYVLEQGYIEKDGKGYFLCKGDEKLFKFDGKFSKKLDELKLEFGDIEEVFVCDLSGEPLNKIDSSMFNKKINEKSIFIYSNLTGNLVI
ncbi:MAG: ATP-binding cassette domain-containing protein [Clostridia bacterium]|nr:ATP-binding cassette domain-containing protein [Clostridia bacterium]